MNERIKELAVEADLLIKKNNGDEFRYGNFDPRFQKFAELIVQECAQVSEDDISDGDACCTNTADRIARQIKRHFGVEE